MTTPGLTRALAARIATTPARVVPDAALAVARLGTTDCVGVMLAAAREPVTRILRAELPPVSNGDARLLFSHRRAAAADAALVNATAAHALDYDDTGLEGHPSVVLTPVALALGELTRSSGRAMLAAYVTGYEVWAELLARETDRLHPKGWHPTAIFGTVAAAAAAAHLLKLDADRTTHALGIAASMSAGLVANFGAMAKPLHAGRAAQSGIVAARLAARGLTAGPDVLEHPAGFLRAFAPAGRADIGSPLDPGRWRILESGINIKCYPICYSAHRAIDAALALHASHAPAAEDIGGIEVSLGRAQSVPLRNHRPRSMLEAKFSGEFAVVAALLAGRVTDAELDDAFLLRPDVQALMERVTLRLVDETDPEDPLFAPFDEVKVTCRDGRVLASPRVTHPRGHAKQPISRDDLRAKFLDCTAGTLDRDAAHALFERLGTLESLPDAAALYGTVDARID